MESEKDTIETLKDIVSSMEKEIGENRIAVESVIKQCFDSTNRVCQNPDSVSLEKSRLQNEFERISAVIKEELENCDHMEGLAREREDISIKLQNASFVLGLVTDYQHIYDKLVLIDGALQKNDLPSSVTSIVEVKALLESVGKKDEQNQSLLTLLQRAYRRKITRTKATLTQLLNQRIAVDATSFVVREKASDCTDPAVLPLSELLRLAQSLEVFEDYSAQLCSRLHRLCDACLATPALIPAEAQQVDGPFSVSTWSVPPSTVQNNAVGLSPSNVQSLVHFATTRLLAPAPQLAEPFAEGVYAPVEQALLAWMKQELPKDSSALAQWQESLAPALELEQAALRDGLLRDSALPLTAFSQSIETEWVRARQVRVLGECRRLLLTASRDGCLYDVATDDEGAYDARRRVGPASDAREEDELQALLALPRCKIGSEYHAFVLQLHAVVREAASLHNPQAAERFLGVLRQLVALVLLVNSEAQDSVEANCLRFNNLGVVLYHLFFLPYFYAESLAEVNTSVFVCVEEMPRLREVQHRAYDGVVKEVERRVADAMKGVKECSEEKEVELLTPLKEVFDVVVDILSVETRKDITQKIADCVDSLSLNYHFVVGRPSQCHS
ncbi:hypothetical protein WA577_001915 [Blastocystis sp. JDR]